MLTQKNLNAPLSLKGIRRLALSAVAALALSGCMNGAGLDGMAAGQTRTMPHERFPIQVSSTNEEMSLMVPSNAVTLSPEDRARVSMFAASYRKGGHGELWLASPTGSSNEAASGAALAEISKVFVEQGLSPAAITMTTYHSSADNAPITLRFKVYDAHSPNCRRWDQNLAVTPRNGTSPNFGCATQSNLAAMLDDPHDLVEPRDMTPADADRRNTVVDKYRSGEPTATARGSEESGAVTKMDE
ncbi:MAG: hypothetical protein EP347_11495 [Alphaproteobacteria bacterium]|nr:MAG: hypothetical protein EP347_11495 [Alphaproteobacteria bacterium]